MKWMHSGSIDERLWDFGCHPSVSSANDPAQIHRSTATLPPGQFVSYAVLDYTHM